MIYKIKTIKLEYKIQESKSEKITSSETAAKILKQIYQELDVDQEHFCILTVNTRNVITGYKIIASGGQNSSLVDPKIVFRNALLLGAAGIILVHNHPSNELTPSQDDIEFTQRLKEAGKLLEITILDHIVISQTTSEYYSFADKGLIK